MIACRNHHRELFPYWAVNGKIQVRAASNENNMPSRNGGMLYSFRATDRTSLRALAPPSMCYKLDVSGSMKKLHLVLMLYNSLLNLVTNSPAAITTVTLNMRKENQHQKPDKVQHTSYFCSAKPDPPSPESSTRRGLPLLLPSPVLALPLPLPLLPPLNTTILSRPSSRAAPTQHRQVSNSIMLAPS